MLKWHCTACVESLVILLIVLQNFKVDKCGPVHIIIGDGGNIEGVCKPSAL